MTCRARLLLIFRIGIIIVQLHKKLCGYTDAAECRYVIHVIRIVSLPAALCTWF